jgi:hypothetical protein
LQYSHHHLNSSSPQIPATTSTCSSSNKVTMDNLHTSLFLTTTPQPVIPSFIDLYLTKITDDHAPYLKESIIDIVTDFIKLVFCYW